MHDSIPDVADWLARREQAFARIRELRVRELDRVDVAAVIDALEDAFQAAIRQLGPSTTSGLVEQQAWFAKGRP